MENMIETLKLSPQEREDLNNYIRVMQASLRISPLLNIAGKQFSTKIITKKILADNRLCSRLSQDLRFSDSAKADESLFCFWATTLVDY